MDAKLIFYIFCGLSSFSVVFTVFLFIYFNFPALVREYRTARQFASPAGVSGKRRRREKKLPPDPAPVMHGPEEFRPQPAEPFPEPVPESAPPQSPGLEPIEPLYPEREPEEIGTAGGASAGFAPAETALPGIEPLSGDGSGAVLPEIGPLSSEETAVLGETTILPEEDGTVPLSAENGTVLLEEEPEDATALLEDAGTGMPGFREIEERELSEDNFGETVMLGEVEDAD